MVSLCGVCKTLPAIPSGVHLRDFCASAVGVTRAQRESSQSLFDHSRLWWKILSKTQVEPIVNWAELQGKFSTHSYRLSSSSWKSKERAPETNGNAAILAGSNSVREKEPRSYTAGRIPKRKSGCWHIQESRMLAAALCRRTGCVPGDLWDMVEMKGHWVARGVLMTLGGSRNCWTSWHTATPEWHHL